MALSDNSDQKMMLIIANFGLSTRYDIGAVTQKRGDGFPVEVARAIRLEMHWHHAGYPEIVVNYVVAIVVHDFVNFPRKCGIAEVGNLKR